MRRGFRNQGRAASPGSAAPRAMQALVPHRPAGDSDSEGYSDEEAAVLGQNVQYNRLGRPQLIQTIHRVINIPRIIEPLWRIELGPPAGQFYNVHQTYSLYEGNYGPFRNVLIKEAVRGCEAVEKELAALAVVAGKQNFQQIRGSGVSNDKAYIVVDKCGEPVSSFFRAIRAVPQEILPIIYRALIEAIDTLTIAGFVHRDLSCDNIYLSSLNMNTKVTVGGLKHALSNEGSRLSLNRRSDIPVNRLVYRYRGYGHETYNWRTEYFLVGCIMNALLNNRELRSNVVLAQPVLPDQELISYIGYHVLHLNFVMMSAGFQQLLHDDIPIIGHHLFWDSTKSYVFICSCYDYLDGLRVRSERGEVVDRQAVAFRLATLKESLERRHGHLFLDIWPQGWAQRINSNQIYNFLRASHVNFTTVFAILATFRNRGAHHHEDQDQVRNFFGALPDQYFQKWMEMFPGLLSHLVRWALINDLHIDECLTSYFEQPAHGFWDVVGLTSLDAYVPTPLW